MQTKAANGLFSPVPVKTITADAPWRWLGAGVRDMRKTALLSLTYGAAFVVVSLVLSAGLWAVGLASIIPALAGGFLILGPLIAVGLYEMSRSVEEGRAVSLQSVLHVAPESRMQLVYMGLLLMLLYLAWLRVATLLYALFAHGHYVALSQFIAHTITTVNGLALLAIGSLIGGAFAFVAFMVSAVSIPLLMDRRVDVISAIVTSINAVRQNPAAMVLWAWLIVVLIGFGVATLFVGLVFVFPLVGHATWHAYRDLVGGKG